MNLIRLIKLKKINGVLDNSSEIESKFVSYFNNLKFKNTEIHLDVNNYQYVVYNYGMNDKIYVKQYINSNHVEQNYIWLMTWDSDVNDYTFTMNDLDHIFTNFIRKHLNLINFKCLLLAID